MERNMPGAQLTPEIPLTTVISSAAFDYVLRSSLRWAGTGQLCPVSPKLQVHSRTKRAAISQYLRE